MANLKKFKVIFVEQKKKDGTSFTKMLTILKKNDGTDLWVQIKFGDDVNTKVWKNKNQIVSLILFVTPVVLLFTLFVEPNVGKVPTKRLGGDSRGPRNRRHIYSLLAMQQPYQQTHYILSSHG